MHARTITHFFIALCLLVNTVAYGAVDPSTSLGWMISNDNRCGGYYLEAPFPYPDVLAKKNLVEYRNNGPTLFSLHGTSVLQGDITVTQNGQQVTANKALLYRNPKTGKLNSIDLFGRVNLREPNSLIVAEKAHINFETKIESLNDILYRTTIYNEKTIRPVRPPNEALQKARKVTQLSAWGNASAFSKTQPKVYEFDEATYSTCPPSSQVWQVKASHIELNKMTGRGSARHARLYVEKIPVFYTPYLNFPIDDRRETGLLSPIFGSYNQSGPFIGVPFYWNMAPNYDMKLTPVVMEKSGLQVNNLFRYLTPYNNGEILFGMLPNDKAFSGFQTASQAKYQSIAATDQTVRANLNRLENAGATRGELAWRDHLRLSSHWFSDVNYNYVTDDYYLRNFSHNLDESTENQLLQKADINYTGPNWNFTGRVQQYQTLHPVDSATSVVNQYIRLPQLALNADYPNQAYGLHYAMINELTHFDIRKMPGLTVAPPVGNRLHTQPSVNLPLNWPFFYVNPRVQLALSKYELRNVSGMTANPHRALPILDIASGLYFDRDVDILSYPLRQTLEPEVYYAYVPYRNQSEIPNFDTTENTLTYDQLFTYNRFSGLDRIGDANQLSIGLTTRFQNRETGFESIRASVGEIIYFAHRRVTLCPGGLNCTINPPITNMVAFNKLPRSPLAAIIDYHLNPGWSLIGNTIWNTQMNEMDNQTIALQYHPDSQHLLNAGYNFARNGDVQPTLPPGSNGNNLKQLNFSFAWPLLHEWSAVGEWTQSINQARFQNLLYGLQYDSCCWAVRLVGGRSLTHLDLNDKPIYDSKVYLQFSLRGLSNVGYGDPTQSLSSNIGGYDSTFGQNF